MLVLQKCIIDDSKTYGADINGRLIVAIFFRGYKKKILNKY